jgi:nitroreductase
MKTKIILFLFIVTISSKSFSQQVSGPVTDMLLSAFSERNYNSNPVTDQQLDVILKCGIKAPSARNNQPWRFTVVKDEASMKEIINDVLTGNVLIIVSGAEGQNGSTPDFDCGLAAENMFIAAHGLGLGARIYGSPAAGINSKREIFQVPAGYKAVVVLRIGNVDKSVDASSGATPRKSQEEMVNFKK